jgi:hypothetical protein
MYNTENKERRRNPSVTKQDVQDIFNETMEKHLLSDSHQFVQAMMLKEKRKQDLYEALKKHIFGWAAVCALTFLAISIWHGFIDGIRDFIGIKK